MIVLLDFILPGVVPKWAIFAPVFIPIFSRLDVAPQTVQAAYIVGDGPMNVLTPLMVYLPFIVTIAQRYDKKSGIGTIIALMIPYAADHPGGLDHPVRRVVPARHPARSRLPRRAVRSTMRRTIVRLSVLSLAVVAGAACADDSAQDRACDARDDLAERSRTSPTMSARGTSGMPATSSTTCASRTTGCATAVTDLAAEQRDELRPDVEGLATDVAAVGEAQDLDELGTLLEHGPLRRPGRPRRGGVDAVVRLTRSRQNCHTSGTRPMPTTKYHASSGRPSLA